jgi:LmbE family N-acetylglucosaminyl deacetylase
MNDQPRLLIIGAHPDDAEYHAGGLATIYRSLDRAVKMVSVTNGAAGHHERSPKELIPLRRREATAAGEVIGAAYETWDFSDGSLEPTLEVRHRIIREIRRFQPSLVLTHRSCDYHPDHRAVGQCVQDASYMVTVPHVEPDVPALRQDPVVAYFADLFSRPAPLRVDVVLDIGAQLESIAAMLACHRSQVFEWLAYHEGILDTVPEGDEEKMAWVRNWSANHIRPRAERFRAELLARFGEQGGKAEFVEMFEISEYARQPDPQLLARLFPTMLVSAPAATPSPPDD